MIVRVASKFAGNEKDLEMLQIAEKGEERY